MADHGAKGTRIGGSESLERLCAAPFPCGALRHQACGQGVSAPRPPQIEAMRKQLLGRE